MSSRSKLANKVVDMFTDWMRKDKDAQQEGVKRLGLGADNTAQDRAKAMGFGDDVYHGTYGDFNEFKHHKNSPSQAFFNSFDPDVADEFGNRIMPIKTRANNIFDYENTKHVNDIASTNEKLKSGTIINDMVKTGNWQAIENGRVQDAIKSKGFDGFNVREHGVKNTGVFNNTDIRGKFAHFNPKYLGVGAGSVLSADIMADELDLEFKGLLNEFE